MHLCDNLSMSQVIKVTTGRQRIPTQGRRRLNSVWEVVGEPGN